MTLNNRGLKRVYSPQKSQKLLNTSLRKKVLAKQINNVQFGESSKANLKVVVRVRPQNERELNSNAREIVKVLGENMLLFDPKEDEDDFFFKGTRQRRDINRKQNKEQRFLFEHVFNENSTNSEIFEATTKDVIDTILNGFNCSVFAYGATGAGKTFTMLGTPDIPGIAFLTVMELFNKINEKTEEKKCEVAVSYLEVYNETVKDLLSPGNKLLNLRESGKNVEIQGLSRHKPESAESLMEMLAKGNQNRSQHPTDLNSESSRSHAVFQVFVKIQDRVEGMNTNVSVSKLSMIDLAGSERGCATGYKGVRFREGASINRSLLALGNCINALADGQKHIPYRDSKLTRLLKDSLGGNCRSVMIAAVSPASLTYEDTFNTLRYANRAKTIKTTVSKNLLNVNHHVSQYGKIIESLKEEIQNLQFKNKQLEEKQINCQCSQRRNSDVNEGDTDISRPTQDIDPDLLKRLKIADDNYKAEVKEVLRLESCEKKFSIKVHHYQMHYERASLLAFATSLLDKSVSKSDRLLKGAEQNLDLVRGQLKTAQCRVSKAKENLQKIVEEIKASNQISKVEDMLQINELKGAARDHQQANVYLQDLIKTLLSQQMSSEKLFELLLTTCKQFYLSLRRMKDHEEYNPDNERMFKDIVKTLDNYRVAFAESDNTYKDEDLKLTDLVRFSTENKFSMSPVIVVEHPKAVRSILMDKTNITENTSRTSFRPIITSYDSINKLLDEDDAPSTSSQPDITTTDTLKNTNKIYTSTSETEAVNEPSVRNPTFDTTSKTCPTIETTPVKKSYASILKNTDDRNDSLKPLPLTPLSSNISENQIRLNSMMKSEKTFLPESNFQSKYSKEHCLELINSMLKPKENKRLSSQKSTINLQPINEPNSIYEKSEVSSEIGNKYLNVQINHSKQISINASSAQQEFPSKSDSKSLRKSLSAPMLNETFDLNSAQALEVVLETSEENVGQSDLNSTYVQENNTTSNQLQSSTTTKYIASNLNATFDQDTPIDRENNEGFAKPLPLKAMPSRSRQAISLSSLSDPLQTESKQDNTLQMLNSLNSTFTQDEISPDVLKQSNKQPIFVVPSTMPTKSILKKTASSSGLNNRSLSSRTPCKRSSSTASLHNSAKKNTTRNKFFGFGSSVKRSTSFLNTPGKRMGLTNQENIMPSHKLKPFHSSSSLG